MSEAATPAVAPEGTPPQAPAATPATAEPAAPAAPAPAQSEQVTLTKEEHDQLSRDAARARSLQSKADRYDRVMSKRGNHFTPQAPTPQPTAEELAEQGRVEDQKAERGILALSGKKEFRELFDADPTLHSMVTNNPLALLPIYAGDALDAEDALSLITDAFTERATDLKKPATPPEQPPATPPETPPAGAVNTQEGIPNEAAKEALKNPNLETAVAGSIRERLKGMGGRSS